MKLDQRGVDEDSGRDRVKDTVGGNSARRVELKGAANTKPKMALPSGVVMLNIMAKSQATHSI